MVPCAAVRIGPCAKSIYCQMPAEIVELFPRQSVYCDRLVDEPAGLGSPMSVEESDLKLVEKVQRGERAAFDLLVLRYQHKVLKLIMRYVHDATEAEDIAQEAFVKAYRALQSFRGDSAFYTWLYRIAINTAKNALVANKRRPMDYDLDLQDPEQYDLHARLGGVRKHPKACCSRTRFATP